jgi:hypothetical protein
MKCPHCEQSIAPHLVLADYGQLSTATDAQEQRIIELLRTGPKTTDQLRAAGCFQTSARIWKLRHVLGYQIKNVPWDGIGADNQFHRRLARYILEGEPAPSQPQEGPKSGAEGEGGGEVACTH